jgi:hypothetical protein
MLIHTRFLWERQKKRVLQRALDMGRKVILKQVL